MNANIDYYFNFELYLSLIQYLDELNHKFSTFNLKLTVTLDEVHDSNGQNLDHL